MATKVAALVDDFDKVVTFHEEASNLAKDSIDVKAAKQSTSLVETLASMEQDHEAWPLVDELIDRLVTFHSALRVPSAMDRTEGDAAASSLAGFLAIPEDFRPAGFDEALATRVVDLIARWEATAPSTRKRGTGEGTPPSAKVGHPVRITFTYPETDAKMPRNWIEHDSTWSSLSNEMTFRARTIDGIPSNAGYKRPESAEKQWKAAVESIKSGGEGGTVIIPTDHGDMIAEVQAVR